MAAVKGVIFLQFSAERLQKCFRTYTVKRCKTIAPSKQQKVNCRCTVFRLGGFPHPHQTWMEWGGLLYDILGYTLSGMPGQPLHDWLLPAAYPSRLAMKEAVFTPRNLEKTEVCWWTKTNRQLASPCALVQLKLEKMLGNCGNRGLKPPSYISHCLFHIDLPYVHLCMPCSILILFLKSSNVSGKTW